MGTSGSRLRWWALLGVAALGCGDFIEFEPGTGSDVASDAGVGLDGDGTRAFYRSCQAALALPEAVDDADYGALLARHVATDADGFARVDYVGWSRRAEDLAALDTYLADLATAEPGDCALAFWINAYNASVLRGVLERFDGDTGYSVSEGDFAFFSQPRHQVAGLSLTLDELEHGVIRGDWEHPNVAPSDDLDALRSAHAELWQGTRIDARIHMALNCAALGCPNLGSAPYRNAELDARLQAATTGFLDNGDKGAGAAGVSQLFQWFARDFQRDSGSVEEFIRRHRSDGIDGVDVDAFIEYDWSLNTQ